MSFFGRLVFCSLATGFLLALAGCVPPGSSLQDDEKEQHFLLGKSRVNAMDYPGAVEAFQESLEANPRSAAAHFQLACLFDTKISDPAAAIYHYQEYLRLNPKAENSDLVIQRVNFCKQQLAQDVMQLPSTSATQRQLDSLVEKNRQLQAEVDKWRAYYAAQSSSAKTNAEASSQNFSGTGGQTSDDMTSLSSGGGSSSTSSTTGTPRSQSGQANSTRSAKPRTHVVAGGETLASIARKHGISLAALQAANPGINAKKLKVGQALNLP